MLSKFCATAASLLVGVCGVLGVTAPASAQVTVQSPRLYVLDCGTIPNRDPGRYNLTKAEVPSLTMADPCFFIVHPKGTLLYDFGIGDGDNNPNRAADFLPGARSLRAQLSDLGYQPGAITFVMTSHSHGDHMGNANDYAKSTWLVQKSEHEVMFADPLPRGAELYKALRSSKTVLLSGDHDVFGDGSVVVKSLPGHTPGHQGLVVRLRNTGPVFLSGDLYHWAEEQTLNRLPNNDFNLKQTVASRAVLEAFLKQTGAQHWIPHDSTANAKLKKHPNFYD